MTREEAQSCIKTIELLRRLAYNIHGVMDVIDAKNCEKIIEALSREPSEDVRCSETPKSSERIAETAQDVSDSDLILRKAAIESIRECAETAHDNCEWDMEQGYLNAIECVEEEPSAQPDRKLIDDYMWKIKQNISPHTATGGVIAIKYYLEQIYEQIYGEGEKPEWMT